MKLIDDELIRLAKEYGNQDNSRDPVVIARYMSTTSPALWLVTDFDPETGEAVAYKSGIGDDGWDLFNLLDLARMRIPTTTTFFDPASKQQTVRKSFGRVVRDKVFTPRRMSEVMPETKVQDSSSGYTLKDLQELFGGHQQQAQEEPPVSVESR